MFDLAKKRGKGSGRSLNQGKADKREGIKNCKAAPPKEKKKEGREEKRGEVSKPWKGKKDGVYGRGRDKKKALRGWKLGSPRAGRGGLRRRPCCP